MNDLHIKNAGFTIIETLILLFVIGCLSLAGYLTLHALHDTAKSVSATAATATKSTTPTTTASYATLSPATVPSKVPECSQQLTYDSSGDSGPVTCANGDLNVLEWNALAALEPTVMTLGYSPTAAQVQSALCTDASDSDSDANTTASNIIEATTYQITALYYGWNFTPSPAVVLSNGTC